MSDMEDEIRNAFKSGGFITLDADHCGKFISAVAQALTAAGYGKTEAQAVEVVPLVWVHSSKVDPADCDSWSGETLLGEYQIIYWVDGTYRRTFNGEPFGQGGTGSLEAAKAACEADHRERVSKMVRGVAPVSDESSGSVWQPIDDDAKTGGSPVLIVFNGASQRYPVAARWWYGYGGWWWKPFGGGDLINPEYVTHYKRIKSLPQAPEESWK